MHTLGASARGKRQLEGGLCTGGKRGGVFCHKNGPCGSATFYIFDTAIWGGAVFVGWNLVGNHPKLPYRRCRKWPTRGGAIFGKCENVHPFYSAQAGTGVKLRQHLSFPQRHEDSDVSFRRKPMFGTLRGSGGAVTSGSGGNGASRRCGLSGRRCRREWTG